MYILVSNCPQQTLGSKINEINKIVPLIAGEATPATCQATFFNVDITGPSSTNALTTHQHHSVSFLFFPQDPHEIMDTKNILSGSSLGEKDSIVALTALLSLSINFSVLAIGPTDTQISTAFSVVC